MPIAIDSRNAVFITDQGSMRVSRSRARARGAGAAPRRRAGQRRRGFAAGSGDRRAARGSRPAPGPARDGGSGGAGALGAAGDGPRDGGHAAGSSPSLQPSLDRSRAAGLRTAVSSTGARGGRSGRRLRRLPAPAGPAVGGRARPAAAWEASRGAFLAGSAPTPVAGRLAVSWTGRSAIRTHSLRFRRACQRRLLHPRPDPTTRRRVRRPVRTASRRPPRARSAPRSSSLASTDRATTATASPALGVTNFTPIVDRPVGRKSSLIGLRTTWPPG